MAEAVRLDPAVIGYRYQNGGFLAPRASIAGPRGPSRGALVSLWGFEPTGSEVLQGVRHARHGQSQWSASAVICAGHERPE